MPTTLTPHDIIKFKEFIKNKEEIVLRELESSLRVAHGNSILQAAVKLVFEVLNAELDYEFEEADKEFSKINT